jgi:hypothetical protein
LLEPWRRLEVGYVDLHTRVNGSNRRELRGEIDGPSKKQLPNEELGLPTMLKAYLLPSLSLSSSFPREIASFHNRASGFRGRVKARRVTERVCGRFLHVEKLPFLGSRRCDSRVQKQLYLQNGTGYPHQILNEHGKRVDNPKSGETWKTIFADLHRFFAWTVTSFFPQEQFFRLACNF